MNNKYFILLMVLLFSKISFSQGINDQIKDLKEKYNSSKDIKVKAKLAGDISWTYLQVSVDSSKLYAEKSLDLALNSKDIATISQSYNDLANVFYINGNHKKAIALSNEAIKIKLKINDKKGLGSLYAKKANSFVKMNVYDSTMYYYSKAFVNYEKYKDTVNAMSVSSNISATYFTMGNYSKAKDYLVRPINYYKKNKNYYFLANTTLNLASVSLKLNDTINAEKYYKESLIYAEKSSNYSTIAANYNNLSAIYLVKNKNNLALDYALKGLKIREELGIESDIASSKLSVANTYLHKGDFDKAKKYFHLGKSIFEKNEIRDKLKEIYLGLSYVYAHQNNSDSLNFYYKKYNFINEKLSNETFLKNSEELIVKYETEKKEKLLAIAKAENLLKEAKIKKRNGYLIAALGLAFLLGLIGYLVYKQQRLKNAQIRKESELKQALAEIENQNNLQEQRLAISKDLHDNIGSQLTFIISSLDNLKFFEFTKDKLYAKFDSIGGFTRSTITDLRDTIWAMNKEDITFEDLKTRTTNFIEAAKTSLLGIHFEFHYPDKTKEIKLNSLQGIDVYRIVQEAINNSIKHAKASKIIVNFEIIENQISVSILDNGIGFDPKSIDAGNGLSSMKKRAKEIGGVLTIENLEKGTNVSLKFAID